MQFRVGGVFGFKTDPALPYNCIKHRMVVLFVYLYTVYY